MQRHRIVKRLRKGAKASGFSTELGTTRPVATLIHQCYPIQCRRSHAGRLLGESDFSCQTPESRALERDEAHVQEWKRKDWPRVVKTLRGWVHIVFADLLGFTLIPTVQRTRARVDQTPVLRYRYDHARISVIGGLSISPKRRWFGLYSRLYAKNISSDQVHDLIRHLRKHLRGHVIVI
jgi:hypothetical protein